MKSSNKSVYKEVYSYVMDLRQTIFDLPIQSIITRDNVEIRVHPMMLIQKFLDRIPKIELYT